MRIIIKSLFWSLVAVLLTGAAFIGYNLRPVEPPSDKELHASLEAAIGWLQDNRAEVLATDNPILWYMLQRSVELSGDERIQAMFTEYYETNIRPALADPGSPFYAWTAMFNPGSWVPLKFDRIRRLPRYNWLLIYGITCDSELAKVPGIAAQNDPGYCGAGYFLRPTCVTHQLMGVRFQQRNQCSDARELAATVSALQARVRTELTLDPRVVDVYVQRVMMLIESGAPDSVRPVWVRRVLDAQRHDGGWANFQPLVPIGAGRHAGFGDGGGARFAGFGAGRPDADFHATAQGIFLLHLLLYS